MVAKVTHMTSDRDSDCEDDQQVALKKLCVDCGTSKTPLWRSGPAGPKSLCNACGVKRNRNKRKDLIQVNKTTIGKKEKTATYKKHRDGNRSDISSNNSSSSRGNVCSSSSSSKDRLIALWDALNPQNVRVEELNEEQQAALLLLDLSHQFNFC